MSTLTSRQWLLVISLSLGVTLIASLPYLYAFLCSPTAVTYTGLHTLNGADTGTYLALIEQAMEGRILMKILLTEERHEAFILRPIYVIAGRVGRLFSLSPAAAYHWARAATGFALLLGIFHFLRHAFPEFRQRLFAFLLISLSSGLGWLGLTAFGYRDSLDLWMPEAVTFLTLYESPHFCLSVLLMLAVLDIATAGFKRPDAVRPGLVSGLLACWLALEHPYDLAVLACILLSFLVLDSIRNKGIRKPLFYRILLTAALASPGVLFQAWMLKTVPVYKIWSEQNVMPMPAPSAVLMGFGILIPLALIGTVAKWREAKGPMSLALIWCVAAFSLAWMPLRFQRRVLEGVHIPLCILAALGALWLGRKISPSRRGLKTLAASLLILFTLPSNAVIVGRDTTAFHRGSEPFFVSKAFYEAARWLGANASENDVILSSCPTGNLIPGISGRRVFIGHQGQTAHFSEKLRAVNWFFSSPGEEEKKSKFLKESGATLLFLGPWEGRTLNPQDFPGLKKVFGNSKVEIYRITS